MEYKICIKCNEEKSIQEFNKIHKKWSENMCSKCRSKHQWQVQKKSVKGRTNLLYHDALKSSKKRGHAFNLRKEWIEEKVRSGKCEVTGIPFDLDSRNPWMPSLDRKIPSLGYIEENCQVVVWIYNTAKQEFKHEDVLVLADALLNKQEENNE
jgi:transcription elongation factor Elf1